MQGETVGGEERGRTAAAVERESQAPAGCHTFVSNEGGNRGSCCIGLAVRQYLAKRIEIIVESRQGALSGDSFGFGFGLGFWISSTELRQFPRDL